MRSRRALKATAFLVFTAGALLRFTHWGAPLTGDESRTTAHYALRPFREIATIVPSCVWSALAEAARQAA